MISALARSPDIALKLTRSRWSNRLGCGGPSQLNASFIRTSTAGEAQHDRMSRV